MSDNQIFHRERPGWAARDRAGSSAEMVAHGRVWPTGSGPRARRVSARRRSGRDG